MKFKFMLSILAVATAAFGQGQITVNFTGNDPITSQNQMYVDIFNNDINTGELGDFMVWGTDQSLNWTGQYYDSVHGGYISTTFLVTAATANSVTINTAQILPFLGAPGTGGDGYGYQLTPLTDDGGGANNIPGYGLPATIPTESFIFNASVDSSGNYVDPTISLTNVPEPGTNVFFCLGLICLLSVHAWRCRSTMRFSGSSGQSELCASLVGLSKPLVAEGLNTVPR